MGDGGIAALASVIYQGRMQEMEDFHLREVPGMTDKGLIALARAINARGLPNVRYFFIMNDHEERKWTALGFGALTLAFVLGCPRLQEIDFHNDSGNVSSSGTDGECECVRSVARDVTGKVT